MAVVVAALDKQAYRCVAAAEVGIAAVSQLAKDDTNRILLGEAGACQGECACMCA